MRRTRRTQASDMDELAADARALMVATAHVAGERVARARKRLSAALERGRTTAEDLLETSAELAGENIGEVRQHITDALDHGREICSEVRDSVIDEAKAADHILRKNPYQAVGIALGLGALIGYLGSHRSSRD